MSYGETYLLVSKIVASSSYPDQVFVRVYAPAEPIAREEEGSWSVAGPWIDSDLVLLPARYNSSSQLTFDVPPDGTSAAEFDLKKP